jgi:hypothetical protein
MINSIFVTGTVILNLNYVILQFCNANLGVSFIIQQFLWFYLQFKSFRKQNLSQYDRHDINVSNYCKAKIYLQQAYII